ncbi:aromatic ring-hydroxylating dioxygenase subunit alpha [Actinomadura spongiicola]|uniref:Aromatic ring-hydroxylating dioxygenase subunit alpha n=1 Tax=Actinomadura spongiicola TaxID=2303421 RepID=A0A372GA27_9ACTN|nr:aromatic ring-hydroxylating dioxygenase subunit alpha [Actinomadura spongiicola]RFS82225.1 aromatic ring-hydroxylating dioxygenase subunit alpha [Actinomadura spongiicola]
MIPNQWYAILRSEDVGTRRPTGARRLGMELVLWRDTAGRLICQSARCPHKGANMADGRLRGDTLGCPYHDFRFAADGSCTLAPCLGTNGRIPKSMRLDTYPVRERHGLIFVWWGDDRKDLPEIQVPREVADRSDVHATGAWQQPVHYTRYIESLLDFYHVPVVHRDHWFNVLDYIGWAGTPKKLGLDGRRRYLALTKVEDSHLEVDGMTLRHSFRLVGEGDPTNEASMTVTFTFPGMVHIHAEPFDVTVWITPVDDDNTQVLFRWYEDPHMASVLRLPSLRRIVPKLALFAQKRVQEVQDMNVVSRIEPRVSGRGVNRFVAVDELNAKYVVMRDQLRKEAGISENGAGGNGKAPTPGGAHRPAEEPAAEDTAKV